MAHAPVLLSLSLSQRLCFAVNAACLESLFDFLHPKVIRRLLWGDRGLSARDVITTVLEDLSIRTIWNLIASVWATAASRYMCPNLGHELSQVTGWFQTRMRGRWSLYLDLVQELASICGHEHVSWRPSESDVSALFYVITGLECYCTCGEVQREQRKHSQRAARKWLENLKSGGIDLKSYGRLETKTFKQIRQGKIHERYMGAKVGLFRDGGQDRHPKTVLFLTGFTYGPQPEDWTLFWDPFVEDFVEDFWWMIENPPLAIPGSWVD